MRAGFKIEYSEKRRRFVYVRIYSGTLHLRDVIRISEKEKIKTHRDVCSDKR